jgi:hypothetical protein
MELKNTYAQEIIKKVKEVSQTQEDANQLMWEKDRDIKKGYIYINYEKIELQTQTIGNGQLTMCLPENFEPMDELLIAIKYPDIDRPEWIYTNEASTTNLTLSIEQGEIEEEELEEVRDELLKQIEKVYPASPIEDIQMLLANQKKIACFSFTVPLVDGESFNYMFFMCVQQGLLIGTFNCPGDEKRQWHPLIPQFLETLEEVPEEPVEQK